LGWYSDALQECQKTCDLNGGEGCTYLGILYAEGKGVKQDYQKAITYFDKACTRIQKQVATILEMFTTL
ncbi:MAG: sel1 repeat family protein, partial [Butyrivibrio sp.]|nr:sel1 repeat family protein [Butyrivibrio sp.]